MSTNIYVEGDNVDIYGGGSFRGHGRVIEASKIVVRVQFRDQDGETKTSNCQIGSSLSKNYKTGNWEIDVPSSAIDDLQ